MKCRGCGSDTRDIEVKGLGWMHYKCEISRLTSLYDESLLIIDDLEKEIEQLKG